MRTASAWSTWLQTAAAFSDAYETLKGRLGNDPDHLFVFFSERYRVEELFTLAEGLPPGVKVHGCMSCRGVMTEEGMHSEDGRALGLFGILDAAGDYGVGAAPQGSAPREAARAALRAALDNAGRPGELPALVWVNAAPGSEEQILAGIADLVGDSVPVLGGSAADNEVAGRWQLFSREKILHDGALISVLFPAGRTAYSYQCGYSPTQASGVVTSASGRVVHTIDGRPAAQVYREWTGTLLAAVPASGGKVLELTTLAPLGRVVGYIGDIPRYTLAHPEQIHEDGSMSLFSELAPGERVFLMAGSKDSLVSRASRVMEAALALDELGSPDAAGALVVYCAGCMLTVAERMPEVARSIAATLHGKPFVGIFTFGEQGCLLDGQATHGNLMISSLVFGA